jgi:hypothetical protein
MKVIIDEITTEVIETAYLDGGLHLPDEFEESTLIIQYRIKFDWHGEMQGTYRIAYDIAREMSIADLEKTIKDNISGMVESEKGV